MFPHSILDAESGLETQRHEDNKGENFLLAWRRDLPDLQLRLHLMGAAPRFDLPMSFVTLCLCV
jgi:hypothetical protein